MKYTAILSTDEPITEDIIQDLKDTIFFGDDPEYAIEIEDIKLEQEPTTKYNLGVDCISRKQAIERLKLNFPISDGADNSKERYRYMQALADTQAIRELTPVTPQEPRKGHWILDETDNSITCDKCGCLIWANGISNGEAYFCPNCGADMRAESGDKE